MTYIKPELNGHKIAYKGKRYWIFEIDDAHPYEEIELCDADMVFFDKEYGEPLATIKKTQSGRFNCTLNVHADLEYEFDTIADIVKQLPKLVDQYFKAVGS